MDQDTVRRLVQQKLADGRLPRDSLPWLWGRPGQGARCDACEDTIDSQMIVMHDVGPDSRTRQMHSRCFYIWEAER